MYSLDEDAHVIVEIYDIPGHRLGKLLDAQQANGKHVLRFLPAEYGINVSGTYILRLIANEKASSKMLKMVR